MIKRLKIFLDAEQDMPSGFDLHLKSVEESIRLIEEGKVAFVSIGNGVGKNSESKKLVQFIEQAFIAGEIDFVEFTTHASDSLVREEIAVFRNSIFKHLQGQLENGNETGFWKFVEYYKPSIETTIRMLNKSNKNKVTHEELIKAGVDALKRALVTSKDANNFDRFYAWWLRQTILKEMNG